MIEQIITGAIGGLAFSLTGLAKKDTRESFDWKKMAPTIIVAGIVGGLAGYAGQDYGIVANSALAGGVTMLVENIWKAIWRKLM
jgi:hypothetical protein